MLRILPRLGSLIVATGVVIALTVAAVGVPMSMVSHVGSGEPAPLVLSALEQRSYVYASDGTPIAVLHGEINRQPITLPEVPPHVVAAILAVEDAGFWTHEGVNARAMVRALSANVGAGSISQGGSTITQQLVKLSLLGTEQTLDRKVEEIVVAQRLERELTKEEILTRYLNTVYFGNHAYGIQAAAETYFGIHTSQLNLAQAALLAGLIRNPTAYNPVRYPENAARRRGVVVERMIDEGIMTVDERTVVAATPLPITVQQVLPPPDDYFVEEVKQQLLDNPGYHLGETPEERERAVFTGGLRIYTTFDPYAQQLAEGARDDHLGQGGMFDIGPAVNPDTRQPLINPETGQPMVDPATGEPLTAQGTASIVSVETGSGAIRAMVGGPGFTDYKFNLATQNPRQGGSSFKTFVLATLMNQGYSPWDIVDGTGPCPFANPGGYPNPYVATNFDGGGGSVDTIMEQTKRSSNCAYLRLGQIAGLQNVIDTATRLGVTTTSMEPVLSMPLGTEEITPLEMAGAYAGIGNDGVYNWPYYVDRIEDAAGRLVYYHTPRPQQAIAPEAARLVTQILEQNVLGGTGTRARIPGQPAAGKTGTAQDSADAWFVGWTPYLTTAVWVGGIGGRLPIRLGGSGITGGSYPAAIWGSYMRPWHNDREGVGFVPAGPVGGGGMLGLSRAFGLGGAPDPGEELADPAMELDPSLEAPTGPTPAPDSPAPTPEG